MEEPTQNQRVEIKLNGDDEWLSGVCIKPRKMWVELDKPHEGMTIADENCIAEWRSLASPSGER